MLLLDEPLASLDPLARREFLWVLADAVRVDGSTAVLSSHVIADVEQSCDQLVVLGGGRKILELPTATAVHEHHVPRRRRRRSPFRREPRSSRAFPVRRASACALVRMTGGDGGGLAGPGGEGLRAATLEEVVIGYLAHARNLPAHGADA